MSEQKIFYHRHLPHYHPPNATYHLVFRLAGSLPVSAIERLKAERLAVEKRISTISDLKQRKSEWVEHQFKYFVDFDTLLDQYTESPRWLAEPVIAKIVVEAIRKRDENQFDLIAYCIMPNHVHLIVTLVERDSSQFTVTRDSSRENSHTTGTQNSSRKHSQIENPVKRDSSRDNDQHHVKLDLSGTEFSRTEVRPTEVQSTEVRPTEVRLTELTNELRLLKGSTARECNKILNRNGTFWQHESYDHVIRDPEELERTIWYVLNNPVKAQLVESWELWQWSYCKYIVNRT